VSEDDEDGVDREENVNEERRKYILLGRAKHEEQKLLK
jgi:hypothetical protein